MRKRPPIAHILLLAFLSAFLFSCSIQMSGQREVLRTDARGVPSGEARGDALADLEGLPRRSPGAGRDQQHHRCLSHQCGQRRLYSGCAPGHRSAPGETPCRDPTCGREAAGKTGDGKGGTPEVGRAGTEAAGSRRSERSLPGGEARSKRRASRTGCRRQKQTEARHRKSPRRKRHAQACRDARERRMPERPR